MKTLIFLLILNFAGIYSQEFPGIKWIVNENGHMNEIWTSGNKENVFRGEYSDTNGEKVNTINEVSLMENKVLIKRIYSSNGEFCEIEGSFDKHRSTIEGLSYYPLNNTKKQWNATIVTFIPDTLNLSGVWKCNDNGTYYIRQIGDSIVWYGEQNKSVPEFSNIAFGKIEDNKIILQWYDVPKGTIQGFGKITLEINSINKLSRYSATGEFGGSEWERK